MEKNSKNTTLKTKITGIDVGGTFTDMITIDLDKNIKFIKKVSSTPIDPSIAFLRSLSEINTEEVKRIIHGTTHATNTIITRNGALTGVITTRGFKDILEIMRGNRSHKNVYNLLWEKRKHLVPRYLRLEVEERIGSDGKVLKPLNESDLKEAIEFLIKMGVKSIAICFLFSYMNSINENKASEFISKNYNNLFCSVSSDIDPEWREYERFSTTVCDSYVKPIMANYLLNIENKLEERKYLSDLLIMKCNGGIMSSNIARSYPIQTCLSGPAAGVVAGKFIGEKAGFKNIITTDMGGTSFDVGLIKEGNFGYATETEIIEGITFRVPMIDVRSIGAGGGSIALIDKGGVLRVGPQSAGAYPGPVCYGTGGSEPTVTDANLALGRLNPDYFLGGEKKLNINLAKTAISDLGKKIGLSIVEAANGVIITSTANMVQEIRSITTENGYDPREFVLIAAGGAGPLHGALIARELKISLIIIPPFPGLMSAMGLLLSDLRFDNVRTYHVLLTELEVENIDRILSDMISGNIKLIRSEGYEERPLIISSLDMRYLGQNYETNIPVNNEGNDFDFINDRFDEEHKRLYGFTLKNYPREVLRIRTSIIGEIENKDDIFNSFISMGEKHRYDPKPKCERNVYLDNNESVICQIYNREDLPVGFELDGPCLIEEVDSTIFLPKYSKCVIDSYYNILINLK